MITIKKLKEELSKFPDNAVCFAYEGEVIGLAIKHKGQRKVDQGVIPCSEGDDSGKETILLKDTNQDFYVRYTMSKCRKDGTFYGPTHGSIDTDKTICGQTTDHNWYIVANDSQGVIACKKCLAK